MRLASRAPVAARISCVRMPRCSCTWLPFASTNFLVFCKQNTSIFGDGQVLRICVAPLYLFQSGHDSLAAACCTLSATRSLAPSAAQTKSRGADGTALTNRWRPMCAHGPSQKLYSAESICPVHRENQKGERRLSASGIVNHHFFANLRLPVQCRKVRIGTTFPEGPCSADTALQSGPPAKVQREVNELT